MRTVTDRVVQLLADGGLTVGDGWGDGMDVPFVVVWSGDRQLDGTLGPDQRWTHLSQRFQVTCVGRTREQAEWLSDRVDEVMQQGDGDGWHVIVLPRPMIVRDDETGAEPDWLAYPQYQVELMMPTVPEPDPDPVGLFVGTFEEMF